MTSDGLMSDGMTSYDVMSDGGSEIDLQNSLLPAQGDPRTHNCNPHQSEGRVGIFKYNLHMQVVGAFFAFYLQAVLF